LADSQVLAWSSVDSEWHNTDVQGITSGTVQATTSGTSIIFTGVPESATILRLSLNAVSTNGTNNLLIQIGNSSLQTSGYVATTAKVIDSLLPIVTNSTAGFIMNTGNADQTISGTLTLIKVDDSSDLWSCNFTVKNATTACIVGGGDVTVSGGYLDRIGLTTVGGTDTFDNGNINITYI
jgi:hypothetical protein